MSIQHIQYAKTKSYAILRREDPEFVPPNAVHPASKQLRNGAAVSSEKRSREDDEMADGTRQGKREKPSAGDDDDDDEMELEDDDTGAKSGVAARESE